MSVILAILMQYTVLPVELSRPSSIVQNSHWKYLVPHHTVQSYQVLKLWVLKGDHQVWPTVTKDLHSTLQFLNHTSNPTEINSHTHIGKGEVIMVLNPMLELLAVWGEKSYFGHLATEFSDSKFEIIVSVLSAEHLPHSKSYGSDF